MGNAHPAFVRAGCNNTAGLSCQIRSILGFCAGFVNIRVAKCTKRRRNSQFSATRRQFSMTLMQFKFQSPSSVSSIRREIRPVPAVPGFSVYLQCSSLGRSFAAQCVVDVEDSVCWDCVAYWHCRRNISALHSSSAFDVNKTGSRRYSAALFSDFNNIWNLVTINKRGEIPNTTQNLANPKSTRRFPEIMLVILCFILLIIHLILNLLICFRYFLHLFTLMDTI